MELKLKIVKGKKFNTILEVMSAIPPWNSLRKREKDVLAALYKLNYEYSHMPLEQREMVIFHKNNRQSIADSIGISKDSFYNITMDLRKKGLLGDDKFVEKYIINNTEEVIFKLIEKE